MKRKQRQPRPAKPSFAWQGALILLPVALVSAIALASILQDRAAVESEARRSAQSVAQRLQEELGSRVGRQLAGFDRISYQWLEHQRTSLGEWHASELRRRWTAMQSASYPQLLSTWQTNFPGLEPEDLLPNDFNFDAQGRLRHPKPYDAFPVPPAWLEELDAEQSAAWEALHPSDGKPDPGTIPKLAAAFLETNPPAEAAANARFLTLRTELASLSPEEAIRKLRRFPYEDRRAMSAAGVPLANLAFAEAIRHAQTCGPTEDLWRELNDQVYAFPSILLPVLLDKMESLVATNRALVEGVQAWRILWQSHERLRSIARAIQPRGPIQGLTTNLWIDHGATRWFCVLSSASEATIPSSAAPATNTNAVTAVRIYPKAALESAFARALREAGVVMPEHFRLAAALESEPLAIGHGAGSAEARRTETVFGEASDHVTYPARVLLEDTAPPGQQPAVGPEYEMLASRPRFTLQVLLADRAALFAAYRRRALLLGGCVAAASFAALVGVVGAWRGFKRQRELNEAKTNFVSSVSHELRAPIASVRLMAESLDRGKVAEPDKQREYFRFILQECRRLSALIENVLDFSRIEQGRKEYDFEPTDVVALVEATMKLMAPYAAEKQVELKMEPVLPEVAELKPGLVADGRALQQALVNLIDNAIKHSPPHETVTVDFAAASARPEEGASASHSSQTLNSAFCISVTDHGPGIPSEDHARIFERFYRRGSELRRETLGVGIGLSIVKHIVEAHGGRVTVRSSVGEGSRFTMELPINGPGSAGVPPPGSGVVPEPPPPQTTGELAHKSNASPSHPSLDAGCDARHPPRGADAT